MNGTDTLRRALWRLFRPIPEELAFMVFTIILVTAIAAYQVSSVGGAGADSQAAVTSLGTLIKSAVSAFDDASIAAKVLLFGFWFIVGTVLYFIVWFCISLFIDIYNDVVISAAFVHPRSFHQSQYWAAIAGRSVVRGLAGISLVVFSVVAIRVVGFGYVDAAKALIHRPVIDNIVTFALATLICALSVHLALVLYKVAFLKLNEIAGE